MSLLARMLYTNIKRKEVAGFSTAAFVIDVKSQMGVGAGNGFYASGSKLPGSVTLQ